MNEVTLSAEAASEIHAILLQEANNLETDSTYEEAGVERKKIPWRARVAIRREIERLRKLAAELKPKNTAQ